MMQLRDLEKNGQSHARIGLLEPLAERDSLALALAKACTMSELGATHLVLQNEIARVMEPHASGGGRCSHLFFENPDLVCLRDLAAGLSQRQVRQLAQDMSLAVFELGKCPEFSRLCQALKGSAAKAGGGIVESGWGSSAALVSGLGSIESGHWSDPLGSQKDPSVARKSQGFGGKMEGRVGESSKAEFACKRLSITWSIA